jgi:leucyl aminopeptidase (aminopeptidase T)
MTMLTPPRLMRAADNLVRDHFAVGPGESVLITGDTLTEHVLLDAVAGSVVRAGAKPLVALAPPLPYQGGLSDPYVADPLKAAAVASDVWFDFCFPYHAGSGAHSAAMAANRCRYALLATAAADSFERLYGCVDFPAMMEFNVALAEFFSAAAGERVRFTCPAGTDVSCALDKLKIVRQRVAQGPGMQTVPGTQSFYPVKDSVRGRIVIQALFDEYYRALRVPIAIEAEGRIQRFTGGAAEDRQSFERALRRASGGEHYGNFIHFTCGFHPGTKLTQRHFIEDIRIPGSNAIGMGLPWWEPGGGENHPDGIVLDQSLWVGDTQLVRDGLFVGPERLKRLHDAMSRRLD